MIHSYAKLAALVLALTSLSTSAAAQILMWQPAPGIAAADIAVATDGTAWAVSSSRTIHRMAPGATSWTQLDGSALRVAVQGVAAWIVAENGTIQRRIREGDRERWITVPGPRAVDIGANATGVWAVGDPATAGGNYSIYQLTGTTWRREEGAGAVRIDVDSAGNPWVLDANGALYAYFNRQWQQFATPEAGADLSVDVFGQPWIVTRGGALLRFNAQSKQWENTGATATVIADRAQHTWHVSTKQEVQRVYRPQLAVPPPTTLQTTDKTLGTVTIPKPQTQPQVQASGTTPRPNPKDPEMIFPRHQTWEAWILHAMGYPINFTGSAQPFQSLRPLDQAFGLLGLKAAEIAFAGDRKITAEQVIAKVQSDLDTQRKVRTNLGMLVVQKVRDARDRTPQTVALRAWSAELYRVTKIGAAHQAVREYQKWSRDPCGYEGGRSNIACTSQVGGLLRAAEPPPDIILANAMASHFGDYAKEVGAGVAIGLAALVGSASAVALVTSLGIATGTTAVIAGETVVITTSLAASFTSPATVAAAQSGVMGAAGWTGAIAGPVAAAVMAVVVGTIETFRVVEAGRVEPMIKAKLGAAMTQPVIIENELADGTRRDFFFLAFQNAAVNRFQIPQSNVDGEVRFYCQAGYVCRFTLRYNDKGGSQSKTTRNLSVGTEETFPIPASATNIVASGHSMQPGGSDGAKWQQVFSRTIQKPTYIGYIAYGTVFSPQVKEGYPEIEGIVAAPGQLVITHGGGYTAWVRVDYAQGGKNVRAIEEKGTTLGWQKKLDVPKDATNLRLQVWAATGLAWEPWRSVVDKAYPLPPSECIKVYGTTLDSKWNNECR